MTGNAPNVEHVGSAPPPHTARCASCGAKARMAWEGDPNHGWTIESHPHGWPWEMVCPGTGKVLDSVAEVMDRATRRIKTLSVTVCPDCT